MQATLSLLRLNEKIAQELPMRFQVSGLLTSYFNVSGWGSFVIIDSPVFDAH